MSMIQFIKRDGDESRNKWKLKVQLLKIKSQRSSVKVQLFKR